MLFGRLVLSVLAIVTVMETETFAHLMQQLAKENASVLIIHVVQNAIVVVRVSISTYGNHQAALRGSLMRIPHVKVGTNMFSSLRRPHYASDLLYYCVKCSALFIIEFLVKIIKAF